MVRVLASGICGSDVMEWYRLHKAPLVLGHEIAGTIEEVGEGLSHFAQGQRLACAHHVPCGTCNYCKSGHETVCETLRRTNFDPGGFCEFVRIPKINIDLGGVFPLPEAVSFDEATFVEPLACVLRGQRLARIAKGQTVAVFGSGIAGILHIHLAKVMGAGTIIATDILPFRLQAAARFGADSSISAKEYTPERLRDVNQGRLADVVIISTGASQAVMQALASVERGGTVLFFAPTEKDTKVPFPLNELFWRTEITLTSSYGAAPFEYQQALDLIAGKKVDVRGMITHRLPLSEAGLGFRLVSEGKDSIKVIIHPNE